MKLPKKFSVKTWYHIGFILVLALLANFFYQLYSMTVGYLHERTLPPKEVVKTNPVAPPQFFRFAPPPQQLHKYAVFSMNRAELQPASAEKATQVSTYDILGVVKHDQLFLVVRIKPSGKIQLVGQGETINGESTVKTLTTTEVVLSQKNGGEKTHKIFSFNGISERPAPVPANKNRQNPKKQNKKKQTQNPNEGRSF